MGHLIYNDVHCLTSRHQMDIYTKNSVSGDLPKDNVPEMIRMSQSVAVH